MAPYYCKMNPMSNAWLQNDPPIWLAEPQKWLRFLDIHHQLLWANHVLWFSTVPSSKVHHLNSMHAHTHKHKKWYSHIRILWTDGNYPHKPKRSPSRIQSKSSSLAGLEPQSFRTVASLVVSPALSWLMMLCSWVIVRGRWQASTEPAWYTALGCMGEQI
jgi:hypothetical protein